MFTSLDAQANAYELVRRSARTLVSLTFLMSSYTALRRVLYGTKSLPIVFPQLQKLCGTLENGRWFAIPLGTFPRLQMLCDKLHSAWQQRAGGTAHALASLVMQIELPELTTLATHTAAGMDLVPANVPNLRSAEYSIQPFSAERLRDEAVSAQLHRLLLLPHLHRLLLHDQIPTVSVRTDQVDLWHYELRYLNVGLITVSFGDQALSNTLHTLAMYVIRNKTLIIDRRPSEVILARLPQLALVQVQADSLAVDGYLRGLGQQLRFPWSQDVAERVSVVETDLFERAT
ncbi:hypothetical protein DL89DRAFT_290514 [Linderina pennispora]|uniref:Uncharacterized protein n=1 Tax=Linderina pennispora TaxID=61395 RepID=A0A1Y1WGI8_9FUNG|nr:uncharacterized protein DL89DRAFT_290514 [Linderina pennispora]ORX72653.1 hypothetical protein DL89DRAFT_290514 [Linderina pennispora]